MLSKVFFDYAMFFKCFKLIAELNSVLFQQNVINIDLSENVSNEGGSQINLLGIVYDS